MNFKKVFSILVSLFFLVFLFKIIFDNWSTISLLEVRFNYTNILNLVIFSLSVYLINIISWHLALLSIGSRVSFADNFRIWMLANLTRLIPGGIWQYPSRIILLNKSGISKTEGIKSLVVESVFNLSMGSITVLLSLFYWDLPKNLSNIYTLSWILISALLLVLLVFNNQILNLLAPLIGKIKGLKDKEINLKLSIKWVVILAIAFLFRFVITGTTLFFLLNIFFELDFKSLPIIIGIFSFSWLLGYIAIFAPGGLGIFEVSLASMLSIIIPFPIAATAAICFRLLLFIAEGLFLLLSFNLSKYRDIN